jgi:hypothetical protein
MRLNLAAGHCNAQRNEGRQGPPLTSLQRSYSPRLFPSTSLCPLRLLPMAWLVIGNAMWLLAFQQNLAGNGLVQPERRFQMENCIRPPCFLGFEKCMEASPEILISTHGHMQIFTFLGSVFFSIRPAAIVLVDALSLQWSASPCGHVVSGILFVFILTGLGSLDPTSARLASLGTGVLWCPRS